MRMLQGRLCCLEPQVEAHAPEMFVVLCDPAIYEYEGRPPPSEAALAAGYKRKECRRSPDGAEMWLNWVVRLHTGAATGYVQASVLPTGAAYVGYEFGSRFWRQGIGFDAVSTMLAELRGAYGVSTAVAVLKAENFRSLGLLTKLGFLPAEPDPRSAFEHEADERVLLRGLGTAGDV